MQTFLPYFDFSKVAFCLDRRRLIKQHVEVWQILKNILIKRDRWYNHPAVKQWKNSPHCLAKYGVYICDEIFRRGYKSSLYPKFVEIENCKGNTDVPKWLGDERLHISHQSNLIRKFPEHYQKFWPDVTSDLPYFWPSKCIDYAELETERIPNTEI